jgi:hypothetical protein
MEDYLVALINAGREDPQQNPAGETFGLAVHNGLRFKARDHAQYMLTIGSLNHDGLAARVWSANPDPAEANGPPDDGFQDVYCETVAATSRIPSGVRADKLIVERIYEEWRDSAGHRACIFDEPAAGYSVASGGFAEKTYADGDYEMWVSLMVVRDHTPPDYVPYPSPTPTPTPTLAPTPTPTAAPTPTPTPAPTPPPTPSPTPLPTPKPSQTPAPTLEPTPVPTPRPTPSYLCVSLPVGPPQICLELPIQASNGVA